MRTTEQVATPQMTMEESGLTIKNKQLVPSGKNNDGTRKFIETLRQAASDSERAATHSKPYKANLLIQNARQARKEANRIEKLLS